ncbi:MAG: tetratricopeptide repeat protein [candidate division WOR-3 bacterium]|jgi:tetratricopeptide (TPR) repeat protein
MRQIKRGHYKEDEFQSTVEKFLKYVVRHKEKSIFIGVVVLAAIIVIIVFAGRGEQRIPQADLMHTQVLGLMSTGRIQEAESILRELTEKYQNTRAGKIGLYYMGVVTYYGGRFEESLEYFDRFLGVARNDYLLGPSALLGAGSAAEAMKEYEQAIEYYEKLMNDEDSPLHDYAVLGYGRAQGLLGNIEESEEVLEALLEKDIPADVAADAQFYLGYFHQ